MDGQFLEYLIQPVDGGWFHYPGELHDCSIFQPFNYPSTVLEGREVCCIQVANCEIYFSNEIVGVQVTVETDEISLEAINSIIKSVANHIAAVTGQPTVVHLL